MPPDPKREFCLLAYLMAGHARTGGDWRQHVPRLEALMPKLPTEDPLTEMAQSVARRFLDGATEDPAFHGENLSAAVLAYVGQPTEKAQAFAWQQRADLQ